MLQNTFKDLRTAIIAFVAFSAALGLAYPYAITGIAQAVFHRQANGSLVERRRPGRRLVARRPELQRRRRTSTRGLGRRRRRLRRQRIVGLQPRPVQPGARRPRDRERRSASARRTALPQTRRCRSTPSRRRPAASTRTSRRRTRTSRSRASPGSAASPRTEVRKLVDKYTDGSTLRRARRVRASTCCDSTWRWTTPTPVVAR